MYIQMDHIVENRPLKYEYTYANSSWVVREEGIWGIHGPTIMRNNTNQAVIFTAKNNFDAFLWNKHEGDGKILQMTINNLRVLTGNCMSLLNRTI